MRKWCASDQTGQDLDVRYPGETPSKGWTTGMGSPSVYVLLFWLMNKAALAYGGGRME